MIGILSSPYASKSDASNIATNNETLMWSKSDQRKLSHYFRLREMLLPLLACVVSLTKSNQIARIVGGEPANRASWSFLARVFEIQNQNRIFWHEFTDSDHLSKKKIDAENFRLNSPGEDKIQKTWMWC